MAADKAGNVYVACKVGDEDTGRIFRLAAGATAGDELPFPGLKAPERIAVDAAGNVFVTESPSEGCVNSRQAPAVRSNCPCTSDDPPPWRSTRRGTSTSAHWPPEKKPTGW